MGNRHLLWWKTMGDDKRCWVFMAEYFGLFVGLFTVLCSSYMLLCDIVEGPGKQVHVLWVPKQFHSKWNNNSNLSVLGSRFWPASGGNSIILHCCILGLNKQNRSAKCFRSLRWNIFSLQEKYLSQCAVHICASAFAFFTIDTMKAGTSNAHGW